MFDIIGLGYSAVDYLGVVPHMPEMDTKLEIECFTRQGGGVTATAMVAAARLGAATAFVGAVGDDDLGDFTVRELDREGVDTSQVVRVPGASSQFSFIMVHKSTGKRTILWTRSNVPPLDPAALDRDFIASCKVLHIDRHEVGAAIQAAHWAHEAGAIVVMDAGTYAPEVDDLLPHADVLITSHAFATDLTGEPDPAQSVRALLMGRRIAGVTCGDKGSWFATRDGDEFRVPAFEVDVVDTTGAGDVFHGAFSFGLARRWNARQCARFASAVAALKCTKLGGRAGIPTYAQTQRFLSSATPE